MGKKSMPEPRTAKKNQGTSRWRSFKKYFLARLVDNRFQAEASIVLGPYLFVCLIGWWDRDSFWGPKFSFFEEMLVCVLFVLGGRLWDLQHKAETTEEKTKGLAEKLSELQRELDLKQGALGERLLQIKGVSLDITEQLSAVERKIDLIARQT
jgi:hypothetical protein